MRALTARAHKLNRRIYASLPWGYRLSNLIIKLSFDSVETFGRVMHKVFTEAQVKDLPSDERAYGKAFGKHAWEMAMSKLRDPGIVESAASDLMMKWLQRNPITKGSPLKKAENLAISSLINAGIDQLRSKVRRPEDQLPTDNSGTTLDVEDPRSYKNFSRLEMNDLRRDLRRELGDRAVIWFDGQMGGYSLNDVAKAWAKAEGMSSVPSVNSVNLWAKRKKTQIQDVLKDHLKDAA